MKRQNFDISTEQEAEISWIKDALAASSVKEVILKAVRVIATLTRALRQGAKLYVAQPGGAMERFIIPELENIGSDWRYLVERPHNWRKQLWVKGRRLMASTLWLDMLTNKMTLDQAAENWDLSKEAITEITRYCESNRELIKMEALEELRELKAKGINVGS